MMKMHLSPLFCHVFDFLAELGDCNDPRICYEGYVSEFRFVPNQTQELEEQISRFHQHLGYLKLQKPLKLFNFLNDIAHLHQYSYDNADEVI